MNISTSYELLLDFAQNHINSREFQELLKRTLLRGQKSPSKLTQQDDVASCLFDLKTWNLLPDFQNEIESDPGCRESWRDFLNKRGVETGTGGAVRSQEPPFGFINRENELQFLLSSMTSPYVFMDAPAGYGKTVLLKHLQKRFYADPNWLCAYIPEESHKDICSIARAIATDLGISSRDLAANNAPEMLAQFLVRNLASSKQFQPPHSLAILLDVTKSPSTTLIKELLDTFIATVQERLTATSAAFRDGSCQFRVIIAERYATGIDQYPVFDASALPFVRKSLTPFDFDVMRLSVRLHWQSSYSPNENDQIAAHLMHYTGGHPGFFTNSLSFCSQQKGLTPASIFETGEWKHWYLDRLQYWYTKVLDSIPADLQDVFHVICIYRKLDYQILRALIGAKKVVWDRNEFDLADKLAKTYLLSWRGRFLQDDITRRLLAIWVREQFGSAKYITQCQEAERIYFGALSNESLRGFLQPEKWLAEVVFQYLQQHVDSIDTIKGRRELSTRFYEQYLPNCLTALKKFPRDEIRAMWHSIRQTFAEDWEFRFTLNYFLRKEEINSEPFRVFSQQLDALWD